MASTLAEATSSNSFLMMHLRPAFDSRLQDLAAAGPAIEEQVNGRQARHEALTRITLRIDWVTEVLPRHADAGAREQLGIEISHRRAAAEIGRASCRERV